MVKIITIKKHINFNKVGKDEYNMSHVDKKKIDRLEKGQCFEYRDIATDDFPVSRHAEDGAIFKGEVESGKYDNIRISNQGTERITYEKK